MIASTSDPGSLLPFHLPDSGHRCAYRRAYLAGMDEVESAHMPVSPVILLASIHARKGLLARVET